MIYRQTGNSYIPSSVANLATLLLDLAADPP